MSQKWVYATSAYEQQAKSETSTDADKTSGAQIDRIQQEQKAFDSAVRSGVDALAGFLESSEGIVARSLLRASKASIAIVEQRIFRNIISYHLTASGIAKYCDPLQEAQKCPRQARAHGFGCVNTSHTEVISTAILEGVKLEEIVPSIRNILDQIAAQAPTVEN